MIDFDLVTIVISTGASVIFTSETTKSTVVTAGQKVLSGDVDLDFPPGVDADPVRHGRDGPEGPARPTACLVSDLPQTGTVWPHSSGVETGGNVLGVPHHLSLGQAVVGLVGVRVNSASDGTEVVLAGLRVETGNNQRYF